MSNTIMDGVRRAFADPDGFNTSPLYQALARTVVAEDSLVDLASRGRPGQYPTFLFFGAVHQLLLAGVEHPLAGFYPSVSGLAAKGDYRRAGAALLDFCSRYEAELTGISSRPTPSSGRWACGSGSVR
jgi:hypothetical protein